jgi:hypothetical protein
MLLHGSAVIGFWYDCEIGKFTNKNSNIKLRSDEFYKMIEKLVISAAYKNMD